MPLVSPSARWTVPAIASLLLLAGAPPLLAPTAQATGFTLAVGDIIIGDLNGAAGGFSGTSPPGSGRVIRVDPINGAQTILAQGGLLDYVSDLKVDAQGRIVVLESAPAWSSYSPSLLRSVIRIDSATGEQTLVAQGGMLQEPSGFVIDAGGDYLIADTGRIVRLDPDTGDQSVVSAGGDLNAYVHLALDADGNIYAPSCLGSSCNPHAVIKIDPATGAQTRVATCHTNSWLQGIAVDASGTTFYLTDMYWSNAVYRVTASGCVRLNGGGEDPWAAALDADGRLVVLDGGWWGPGNVFRFDTATGSRQTVSSGGLLVDPLGLDIVRASAPPPPPPAADEEPPAVAITGECGAPLYDGWCSTAYTYTMTAADDDSGLADGQPVCRLDEETAPCAGEIATDGWHVLRIDATDAEGNIAFQEFAVGVDVTAPTTVLDSAVDGSGQAIGSGGTLSDGATFTFSGSDAVGVAGYLCRLDDGPESACARPWTLSGLGTGDHMVRIRAYDSMGHVDENGASFAWRRTTPAEAADALLDEVESMYTQDSSLAAPLRQAHELLSDNNPNNDNGACGKLSAFEKQVDQKEKQGKLSAEDAEAFRLQSIQIRVALGC
jgi:sugar lactone lactonase YvrE